MGNYLNSISAYSLYKSEVANPYFVDKTMLLSELFPLVSEGNHHICITRPRRFGKTVMANMIGAFFSKACDTSSIFDSMQIARHPRYWEYRNQHNVIYIDFSKMPRQCHNLDEYLNRIEERLIRDLMMVYSKADITPEDAVWDALNAVFNEYNGESFIFVLDEWDCIFHKDFITDEDRRNYINFLGGLLKDQPYVSLTYMTGILPIAKYSSGSTINNFDEYSMATDDKFSTYFGFTDSEVDMLYERYLAVTKDPSVSREDLRYWYDGYHTPGKERMYNPRSVVYALRRNKVRNYWTNTGPYDEVSYYVKNNVDAVRDDLALMVAGEAVPTRIEEYAATAPNLRTREEIFSAMVVYGFLNYENRTVSIPNKELMDKFDEMMRKERTMGYVYRLARESDRMMYATLNGDTETMEQILSLAHDTETPLLRYNSETELSAVVNLVYLSARDRYRVEREDKAGVGYVDFIFYPNDKNDPGIILELKVDSTPEEAIRQIKDRKYTLRFQGKLGEVSQYTRRILAVGISYDKKTKKHICKVEELVRKG